MTGIENRGKAFETMRPLSRYIVKVALPFPFYLLILTVRLEIRQGTIFVVKAMESLLAPVWMFGDGFLIQLDA